jgi:phosphatidate cytidylyltransferase
LLPRFLAALVGIPILLGAIWLGGPWLTAFVVLIAGLGIREFYRLLPPGAGPVPTWLGILWTVTLVLGAHAASSTNGFLVISAGIWVSGTFLAVLWLIAFYQGRRYLVTTIYLLLGPIYVGLLLGHSLVLRELGEAEHLGRSWLLFAVAVTFASDTGAYFMGRMFGRHAMAPSISPGKTWEGSAGGFIWAMAGTLIFDQVVNLGISLWQVIIIGATVGVLAQCGDLLESKLKRISEVKDTGSIILGHGGVLDRLDSIVISLPAVYYFVVVVFKP